MADGKGQIVFWVARVRCEFADVGAPAITRIRFGTGFWLAQPGQDVSLVTNRHIVDRNFRPVDNRAWRLETAEIEMRHFERVGDGLVVHPDTKFFRVRNLSCLVLHEHADCAIFRLPEFDLPSEFTFQPPGFTIDHLADQEFLESGAEVMDAASFIGFPGSDDQPWWDTRANQPIARMVSLASLPGQPFVNTTLGKASHDDIALVSGLSFGGSSGSPLMLHSKGFKAEPPLVVRGAAYVPSKVIGIMSGHMGEGATSPLLDHTGLSYFTRSTSIRDLL